MKRLLYIIFALKILFFFPTATGQQWMKNIPKEQAESENLSFFDIQTAFESFWAPYDVKKGYYYVNGEKIKAGGWKQFKRWEWFWNDRVDPLSGEFPKTSAFRELSNYQLEHPVLKGTTGASTGNWTPMGPTSTPGGYAGLGRLNCVAFSPSNTSVIYVGAASGGLWKSTNGGTSWVPMSDNTAVLGISDLLVMPGASGDIIYSATGDRDASDNYSVGVLKSTDGGNTWNTTGLSWSQSSLKLVYRLLGDPTNPDVIFAATSAGVYKTTDGGNTWSNLTTTRFIDIKFKPGNNQILYGSTVSTGDIYLSANGGTTWNIVLNTAGSRVELAVTPANPEAVYALISSTSNGLFGVFKSISSGTSFTQVAGTSPNMMGWNCDGSDAGGQGWYDLCIAADPANADIVFVGGVNTWKTINGGATWTISNNWASTCSGTATTVHADKHYLAYQPGTSTLFECNDGGLYKSSNTGTTWAHLGNSLVISQMYRLGVSQTSSADVITGLQDNGTKAMLSNVWKDVIGGDGMECLIDYTNTNVQYGELYYGDIYRTDNRWSSSTYITGSLTGSAGWVTPYVIDPNSNTTLYVGYQDVWKSTNKGTSWTKISAWAGSTLRSLAVAPSSSNTLYAATGSILYRTTDGGASWANITGTLPVSSSNITYVSVKQNDPNTVWVSLGQFNAYGVFQTTDGGITWTNISAGLPSVPINCVIQNKQNTSQVELYAGTDIGVFIKLGSAGWIPYFTGLPNVVVMELEIYYASDPAMSRIRAATYGRGLWESDVYAGEVVVNSPPVFTVNPVIEINATAGSSYSSTLTDHASDPNAGDVLTFSMVTGPTWLALAGNGGLAGIPAPANTGLNSFTVQVADGKGGTAQAVLQISVSAVVAQVPIANFSANPYSVYVGQAVVFSDLSQNAPTSWTWSFGDGKTSSVQNPTNTYSSAGVFSVSLMASNSTGSDTKTMNNLITVTERPVVTYCSPTGITNSNDYISALAIGGTTSTTGKGSSGYSVYNSPVFGMIAGKVSSVTLTPYNSKATTKDAWKIWIDFNLDGDFTDAGENILNLVNRKGKVSATVTVPATAWGQTRMRIAMKAGATMNSCDNNYAGEVEDYWVNITSSGLIDGGDNIVNKAVTGSPLLKLYPNPATSLLNISIGNTQDNTVLHVVNVLGSQLDWIRVESNLVQLDITKYSKGIYFILLEDQNQRLVQKFIKE